MTERSDSIIPAEIQLKFNLINKLFDSHDHEVRLAGGAVRDILLGKEPNDLDFATTATPEEMMNFGYKIHNKPDDIRGIDGIDGDIKIIPTGIEHGTVTFNINGDNFEVTTLRVDKECDGRHAEVEFTDNWEEDAARRDFTVNAMFMDVNGKLYDYFNGVEDLNNRTLKFVGIAEDRIKEDALRIMRYFRFLSKLDIKTKSGVGMLAIKDNLILLKSISKERIIDEIKKLLKSNPHHASTFFNHLLLYNVMYTIGWDNSIKLSFRGYSKSKIPEVYIKTYPMFFIGEVLDNINFIDTWPFSNKEREEIRFIFENKAIPTNPEEQMIDLVMDGHSYDRIIVLLNIWKREDLIDELLKVKYKELPVRGQDFLDAGLTQGKEIGIMMDKAKAIWKMSRYEMTKPQLLTLLGV